MRYLLDHVVVVVDTLAGAADAFRDAGFTVTPGGRHDAVPTENALVVFADGSYLELLAARDPGARTSLRELRGTDRWARHLHEASAVARRFLPTLAGPDGVADFCVRTTQLDRLAAESRRRGYTVTGPVDMGRERPGAEPLAWRLLFPAVRWLPFVIQDRTPLEARVPAGDGARRHANGARGLAHVTVRAAEVVPAAMGWVDHFDATITPRLDGGADIVSEDLRLTLVEGAAEGACAAAIAGLAALPPALAALGLAPA